MLLLMALLSPTVSVAHTRGSAADQVASDTEGPYTYLVAFVGALGDAKSAADSLEAAKGASDVGLINSVRRAKSLYQSAASRIAPYERSADKSIRTSAEAAAVAFEMFVTVEDQFLKLLTQSVTDLAEGTYKPGPAAEITADLAAKGKEAEDMLLAAAIAASFAPLILDPATSSRSKMALTSQQRDDLLAKLKATFGSSIVNGLQSGQNKLTAAAAAVYQVVGDPKRLSRSQM